MNGYLEEKNALWLWPPISSIDIQEKCITMEAACSRIGHQKIYEKGSIITGIGEKVFGIYFLNKGMTVAEIVGENGLGKVVFINRAPCFFNDGPFFGELGTEMEIRTLTDCVITIISGDDMYRLISSNKSHMEIFMRYMARKNCALVGQMTDILTLSPAKRIFKVLACLVQEIGVFGNGEVTIKFTQDELAKICGLHRVTVARAFKRLKSIGVILRTSKSTIVLCSDLKSFSFDEL